jgi:hypothetical protein
MPETGMIFKRASQCWPWSILTTAKPKTTSLCIIASHHGQKQLCISGAVDIFDHDSRRPWGLWSKTATFPIKHG